MFAAKWEQLFTGAKINRIRKTEITRNFKIINTVMYQWARKLSVYKN